MCEWTLQSFDCAWLPGVTPGPKWTSQAKGQKAHLPNMWRDLPTITQKVRLAQTGARMLACADPLPMHGYSRPIVYPHGSIALYQVNLRLLTCKLQAAGKRWKRHLLDLTPSSGRAPATQRASACHSCERGCEPPRRWQSSAWRVQSPAVLQRRIEDYMIYMLGACMHMSQCHPMRDTGDDRTSTMHPARPGCCMLTEVGQYKLVRSVLWRLCSSCVHSLPVEPGCRNDKFTKCVQSITTHDYQDSHRMERQRGMFCIGMFSRGWLGGGEARPNLVAERVPAHPILLLASVANRGHRRSAWCHSSVW